MNDTENRMEREISSHRALIAKKLGELNAALAAFLDGSEELVDAIDSADELEGAVHCLVRYLERQAADDCSHLLE